MDGDVGQVLVEDAAVVGGREVRASGEGGGLRFGVLQGKAIGLGDGRETEGLRGLGTHQGGTGGNVLYGSFARCVLPLWRNPVHRVGGGDGDGNCLVLLKGGADILDNLLADERACGVMKQDVYVLTVYFVSNVSLYVTYRIYA